MPLTKWQVEPTQLIPASSIADNRTGGSELTDFINVMMTSVIRQLSCVSLYAEQVFNELAMEAGGLVQRTSNLTLRVGQLKQYAKTLSPMDDEDVSVDHVSARKPFKSSAMRGVAWSSRSEAIKQTYNNAEPPPALQKLNCYREDGKNCLKLYTNPGFFFELWCSQIQQEVEKKRPARKKIEKKDTGFKAPVQKRKAQGVDREFQDAVPPKPAKPLTPKPSLNQTRGSSVSSVPPSPSPTEKKEFPDTGNPNTHPSSPPPRPAADAAPVIYRNARPAPVPPPPVPVSQYPPHGKTSACLQSIEESEDGRVSDLPPPPSLTGRCESILPPPPPSPVSISPTSRSTTASRVPPAVVSSRLPSAASSFDELPTPPPPLAAGPPVTGKRQTKQLSRLSTAPPRMSMFLLGNSFDELSSFPEEEGAAMLPPPPPALLAPPPPPPPPANICLPPPPALESGFGLRPAASSHPVAQKKRESRSDLLDSIRQGIALRKVEESKQETKKTEDVGGGMFDVQMILEMRRRALEDDDDSDYETGNDDDWVD